MGEPGTVVTRLDDIVDAAEVAPDFELDLGSYADVNELVNDTTIWNGTPTNQSRLLLTAAETFGSYTKSLRHEYPEGTGTDSTVKPGEIVFSKAAVLGGNVQEVWAEYYVKWSANWTLLGNGQGGGIGQKAMFLHIPDGEIPQGGRWGVQLSNNDNPDFDIEGPNDDYNDLFARFASSLYDNEWHTIRRHVDSSGATKTHAAWVDGAFLGRVSSAGAQATNIRALSFFSNLNREPPADQYLWVGGCKIWGPGNDPNWSES